MNIAGRGVFFSEMDDDFQDITGLTEQGLLQRLSCYYLLAQRLIVHPAYFWQSRGTHNLVESVGSEILRPPFVHLELGMHDSIDDYMSQRLSQLRQSRVGTRELRSYELHGADLSREARDLDVRFDTATRRLTTARKRDEEFRGNLEADLNNRNLDGTTLASLLSTLTVSSDGRLVETSLGTGLQTFVTSADLVSVDTMLHQLHARGYPELAQNSAIKRRLLALYYQTYCDFDLIIPGTEKLKPGGIVNPYDTEVFWRIMGGLFGPAYERLASPEEPEMMQALRRIRETQDWLDFRVTYFDFMETLDSAVRAQPDSVVDAARRLHPGKSRRFILARLWNQGKLTVSGVVVSTVGAAGFGVADPLSAAVTGAGVVGMGLSGLSFTRLIRRFNDQYQSKNVVQVRDRIKQEVDRALREISLQRPPAV